MRKLLVVIWLMVPVLVGAYHYGPGQEKLLLDDVAKLLRQADQHVAAEEWSQAISLYDDALNRLPGKYVAETRRLRLERAKAWMYDKKLPQAHDDLTSLVDELKSDAAADPAMLAEARESLANAKYYLTWLMRLEGQPREVWEPEIESSRQTYRLLAEIAQKSQDADSLKRHQEDLESAIRLARMELSDLQGLPLPTQ
jgi:hypothetical protein